MTDESLLQFIQNNGYDVFSDFFDIFENIKSAYKDLEDYKINPGKYDEEEIEFTKADIETWEEDISKIKSAYTKSHKKADWEKEVSELCEWCKNNPES